MATVREWMKHLERQDMDANVELILLLPEPDGSNPEEITNYTELHVVRIAKRREGAVTIDFVEEKGQTDNEISDDVPMRLLG